jgi:hypothetical protein
MRRLHTLVSDAWLNTGLAEPVVLASAQAVAAVVRLAVPALPPTHVEAPTPEARYPITRSGSFEVLTDQLCHLKHRDFVLAHHRLQMCIAKNVPLVSGVLQVARFDVVPDALGDLGSGQRLRPHDGGEFGARD